MIKKTVTYVDYNGVERTEDFHFNLTSAEVMEQELTTPGGFSALLQKIIDANDIPSIVEVVKKILLMSYGVKSDDGRRFVKSAELSEAFKQTEAYTMIFMEIATNAEKGVEFIQGIFPKDLVSKVMAASKAEPAGQAAGSVQTLEAHLPQQAAFVNASEVTPLSPQIAPLGYQSTVVPISNPNLTLL